MPKVETGNLSERMMRHTAVDMEQNAQLLDPESQVYKVRQKYLCRTCLVLLYTGVIGFLGFYAGYTTKMCDDDGST
tara:strand:+ start:6627 stop:6854 length:228 start_codon:yes stop_codon:yes gene_type:complete